MKRISKTAGVRELKSRLSMYLARVRDGDRITITDRGKAVAELSPVRPERPMPEPLLALVRRGIISGLGGKPAGITHPVKLPRSHWLSTAVLEDRR
jgi:prevent-host-death family protein